MAGTFTNLLFHIIFSTKDRVPRIDAVERRLYQYIGGIIRGEGGAILEIGGVPDHVHILAKFKADTSVSEMLRQIKSNSSGWMNKLPETVDRFEWQGGYAAFSVSESQVPAVRKYIQNQKEHHTKVSFKDELIALLEKHGIEYDERYILG
jgi:REP element-mobilizing transposase RayT